MGRTADRRAGSGGARRRRSRGVWSRVKGLFSTAVGRDRDEEASAHLQEIKGLVLIGGSLWLLLSLTSYARPYGTGGENWGGRAGFYLADLVYVAIGWSGHLIVFLGITWGIVLVARKRIGLASLRLLGGLFFLASTALLAELAFGASHPPSSVLPHGPGGWLAGQLVGQAGSTGGTPPLLVDKFGGPGLWILVVSAVLVSFMLATEMAFFPAFVALKEWMDEQRARRGASVAAVLFGWARGLFLGLWDFLRGADLERAALHEVVVPASSRGAGRGRRRGAETAELFPREALLELEAPRDEPEAEEEDEERDGELDPEDDEAEERAEDEDGEAPEEEEEEDAQAEEVVPAPRRALARPKPAPPPVYEPPTPPPGPWRFPPLDLLERPRPSSPEDEMSIEHQARRLESALGSFRVEAGVVGAKVGASVTLFELEVAQGTRLNKVTQLSQEIAAALRAKSVRIIAPIPGKATIGIEVPNERRRVVRLSELITQKAYDKQFMALPLFLGMDAEGTAVVEDLSRMPHLLIAGTTGSGKSVCINTILASLLLTRTPHDIKLILVDPKMVELQMFASVPHLMLPVVTDMRQATNVLLWAVEKMEGRYELFNRAGVRNIKAYNALGEEGLRERLGEDFNEERTPRHVPYIVIVIDEMADLMMTSKKEAELAITRLAQKSRAVGVHVIVATQRPSTDVITGVLKGNLPCRIAFQVASKVDSRVILDHMGAEKLLGQGDMLYTPPQSSQIRRVQGALVEDHEIQALVEFVCNEAAPAFAQELVQTATGTAVPGQARGGPEEDELWDEAVRVILKSRRGSASLLQRALGIGYTRASRLIDIMTAEGIVGDHKGSKAREVLMTLEDWEATYGTPLGSGNEGASDE